MEEAHDPRAAAALSRVGSVLKDKWRLDELLGSGGMASVYAATHRNGKRVAIKVLHREYAPDPEVKARFLREGYLVNQVEHAGVVGVLDDDSTEDGCTFLVMDLLEGESLEARRMRKGGQLPAAEVLSIADQVLDVLIVAHQRGLVHRDLKPENMFLCKDGVVKLLDFGIARLKELSAKLGATQSGGTTMGTPAFMPTEQARGNWDQVDARTDLWALGATMFTLLTGALVHEASNIADLLVAAMMKHPPLLTTKLPAAHPALSRVVDRALKFERDARWPDARAMQVAVRDAYREVVGRVVLHSPAIEMTGRVDRSIVEAARRGVAARAAARVEPPAALGAAPAQQQPIAVAVPQAIAIGPAPARQPVMSPPRVAPQPAPAAPMPPPVPFVAPVAAPAPSPPLAPMPSAVPALAAPVVAAPVVPLAPAVVPTILSSPAPPPAPRDRPSVTGAPAEHATEAAPSTDPMVRPAAAGTPGAPQAPAPFATGPAHPLGPAAASSVPHAPGSAVAPGSSAAHPHGAAPAPAFDIPVAPRFGVSPDAHALPHRSTMAQPSTSTGGPAVQSDVLPFRVAPAPPQRSNARVVLLLATGALLSGAMGIAGIALIAHLRHAPSDAVDSHEAEVAAPSATASASASAPSPAQRAEPPAPASSAADSPSSRPNDGVDPTPPKRVSPELPRRRTQPH